MVICLPSAHGNGLVPVLINVQNGAVTVVDAFAHAGVDEEKQSKPLKHFTVIAFNAVGKGGFRRARAPGSALPKRMS
jgi:hypothetical protein